jgi:hypothetical protein
VVETIFTVIEEQPINAARLVNVTEKIMHPPCTVFALLPLSDRVKNRPEMEITAIWRRRQEVV